MSHAPSRTHSGLPGFLLSLATVFRVANAAFQFVVALEYLGVLSVIGSGSAIIARQPVLASALMGLATGIGLTLLCLLVTYYRRPLNVVAGDFNLVSGEYAFAFDPDCAERATQTAVLEIEAARDGAHLFENGYSWTGSGNAYDPRIEGGSARLLGSLVRRWGWSNYYIELGEELCARERRIVTIVQDLDDPNHRMVPYLTKTVTKPLGDLKLSVRFSPFRTPESVCRVHASGPPPAGHIFGEPDRRALGKDLEAHWRIPHPEVGHWYALEWDWPDAD